MYLEEWIFAPPFICSVDLWRLEWNCTGKPQNTQFSPGNVLRHVENVE